MIGFALRAEAARGGKLDERLDVALSIRNYVEQGGFLFAMCSATDTIDIALAFLQTDIVPQPMDGSPIDPNWRAQADYEGTFAFENFSLYTNPLQYEFSDLDTSDYASMRGAEADYFTLFDFAAKYDPVPAMLTQNHVSVINGFLGQTTGYHQRFLKRQVIDLSFQLPQIVQGIPDSGIAHIGYEAD